MVPFTSEKKWYWAVMYILTYLLIIFIPMWDIRPQCLFSTDDGLEQSPERDAKPTKHIEITHPNKVNLKLAFHKVASFHQHYLTFTPQTYHHPVHRFRSCPTQTTSQSHPHTQVRVQPRNVYNHTYIKFLPGQNKTTSY